FGVAARGQSVVYVLDCSISMGLRGALAAAKRELLASLERLPATARFQVIAYNSSAETLLGRRDELLPAKPENLRRAAAAVSALEATGGTRPRTGFTLALCLHPDVLYFLTDADDDLTDDDCHWVTRTNAGRTVIHTVELTTAHRGRPEQPMQRLA